MAETHEYVSVQGAAVPAIGLGTWRLRGEEGQRAVRTALEIGYRHVDTAQMYDNEADVGRVIAERVVPRESLFITTKLWRDNLRAADVRRTVEESLRRLCSEYVDLLLIHWPNPDVPIAETLGAMAELVEQGTARHIGLSNFPVALTREAITASPVPIFANQVEYHPYLSQAQLLGFCKSQRILLTAYCPLARMKIANDPVLVEIGRTYGKSPGQVTLRWLVQQGGVAAVPKAAGEAHLRANLDVFDFQLTADEMNRVSALARPDGRLINMDFAPEWD